MSSKKTDVNYSWIDKKTKINPFKTNYTFIHPVMKVFRIFIGIFKFPIFLFFFSISLFYFIFALIIPIKMIKKLLIRLNGFFFFKIILILFGNIYIPVQPTPLIETFNEPGELNPVSNGDIIISNFGSYINLFWLHYKYSPIFVIPTNSEMVMSYSFFNIFMSVITGTPLENGQKIKFETILNASKNTSPIVVFPECCPTNGDGILLFHPFGTSVDISNTTIHIYGFSHRSQGISPNFTHGNSLSHIFQMLGRSMSGMKVNAALPQDIPKHNNKITPAWLNEVRRVIGTMLRVPLLDVDYTSSRLYYEYQNNKRKLHAN